VFRAAIKTLKVSPRDDKEAIHKAYVRLVRRFPPEHFPEQFRKIQNAYHELTLADHFLKKVFTEVGTLKTKFQMAAFFWGDRLEMSPTEAHLDSLDSLGSDQEPSLWDKKKQLLANLGRLEVDYRKVDL
jgi:curved DNA-binding protein CbpA